MTGTEDGATPATGDGDAKTFKVSREVIRNHMAGHRCPSCPGLPAAFERGQDLPRCPVFVYAADYVRQHWANRQWLRAANQVADEMLALMRPKPCTAEHKQAGHPDGGGPPASGRRR